MTGAPRNPTCCALRGFTLIELLVVVAVIALLISILLPALGRAREQGRQAVCLANQKTLALAFVQYAAENRDGIVSAWTQRKSNGGDPGRDESWVDWPLWENGKYLTGTELQNQRDVEPHKRAIRAGRLYPYARIEKVYHCPSDRRDRLGQEAGGEIAYVTYSMPNCMNGDDERQGRYGLDWEKQIGGTRASRSIAEIPSPGSKYAFVEESDPRGLNMGSWVMWLNKERWIDPLTVWHTGRSTLGFADGHAIVKKWLDPRTLKQARLQEFDLDAKNNTDWLYMKQGWAVQPKP